MARLDETLRGSQLEPAGPDIVAEDFGGEIVVLNLANGKYFSLPGASAGIWRDLSEGVVPAALIAVAAAAGAALAEAVETVAADLLGEGLLRPRGAPVADVAPKTSFTGSDALPVMESYDDMADLILADPIHDVDESTGWPVKKDGQSGA